MSKWYELLVIQMIINSNLGVRAKVIRHQHHRHVDTSQIIDLKEIKNTSAHDG